MAGIIEFAAVLDKIFKLDCPGRDIK